MSSPLKLGFMASSLCTKPYFNPNNHYHFNPKSLSLSSSSSSSTTATVSPPLRWRASLHNPNLFCRNYNRTNFYKSTRFLSHFRSRTHFIISSGYCSRSGSDSGFFNEMRSVYSNNKMGSDDGVVLYNSSKPFSPSSSSSSSPLTDNHYQRKQQKDDSNSKILTLPTILTLARVAAVPLLISTFYVDTWCGRTATTGIFIAAAITDWLDGFLARKMRLGTTFGAFLDPVADKLMVAATLVLLCTKPLEVAMFGQVPWLLPIPAVAIIGREITMSAVREWAASQNAKLLEAVAVNNLGKWKTATQMTALTILLATRDSSLGGTGYLVTSGVVLLYISAGLSVWSLGVYMSKIWRVLLK